MSGQKLKASHKIAAFIERMLRDISVKEIDVSVPSDTKSLSTRIDVQVADGNVDIGSDLIEMDTDFGSTVSSMEKLRVESVTGISLEGFTGECVSVDTDDLSRAVISEYDLSMVAVSKDYCSKDELKLKYKTEVKPVSFSGFSPAVKWVNPLIFSMVKENLFLMRKLKVRHAAVNLSYVSEKLQLKLWRKAVLTTKKDPKKLELKGFFFGVPVNSIEKMAYDGVRGVLLYSYKQNYRKTSEPMKNVAVFRDVEKNERVVIID